MANYFSTDHPIKLIFAVEFSLVKSTHISSHHLTNNNLLNNLPKKIFEKI